MKAYLNNVVVTVEQKETETASGIVIKEESKNVLKGTVTSIGSKVEDIKENDIITFQKFNGIEVDKNTYVIKDENILSIV